MKSVVLTLNLLLLAVLGCGLSSCGTRDFGETEYMPDMYRQLSVRAQEYDSTTVPGVGTRTPPPFAVPRDFEPYVYTFADSLLADQMLNPLAPTPDVLEAGKKYFNSYCIVCHGARGDGRGYIVPKFTMPPSLYSEKLLVWKDGRIYHTMTLGQGLMSSYASQLRPTQRWAVVHYVRALQRAAFPTETDIATMQRENLTLESDLPDTGQTSLWPKK
ncbi:cytochrome c [candidate division KSB1 bacterium]|nr:cytochrome c [candidate division KSB1 bacterium]